MTKIEYVEPGELVKWFDEGRMEGALIIDVRENDYTTGKVKGSLHYPFHELGGRLSELQSLASSKHTIIFHCYFSQTRGPRAAKLFCMELPDDTDKRVCVLEGGWKTWCTLCRYINRTDLIEPIDPRSH
jgi:Cdc25 family phosphatase